ncbi:acyltransferase [Pseudomonas sp. ZM23]|uniref:Acyltransferase n=1 Tax=Pseudomonas triclosanedens TaxID=2961893 RepID=A0ABY6ZY05_9PSED|nr:acyltransferase [Pseudomonas triclosanedens]MCP8462387.1 acyltransferase [Pseudomonas triclosanedens]MCP8468025.1 acyltransferase [Pseudomonas triclosanedens]MCP8474784.1 acyltransferase [Pseudomonas triclosanedens]WAI49580.1 acyltransferase [Pseudomonas triclosanedens]
MSQSRVAVLDDLRGIAILLVVVYHGVTEAFGFTPPPWGTYWLSFIYAGNTGVTLFFLLSGILVSRPFFNGLRERQPMDLKLYALHRALRILPLYYLAVLVGVLFTGHYGQLPAALLFLAWGKDVGVFSNVWWSLSTEVQFYLFLPIAFALLARAPALLAALLLAWFALFVSICLGWVSFGLLGNIYWALFLGGKLPAFLVGAGIGWMLANQRLPVLSPGSRLALLALLTVLLAAFLQIAVEHGVVSFSWRQPWIVIPESLLWGGVALVLLAGSRNTASPVSQVLRYLGRISYSLYLVHLPLIALSLALPQYVPASAALPVWARLLMGFVGALAVAQASYGLIEKPFLALKSRYSSPSKKSEALPV